MIVNICVCFLVLGLLFLYSIVMEDKYKFSEIEEKMKEYDEIVFKYMYILVVFLFIVYGIYLFFYDSYKFWYLFVIIILVGFVYIYGFLMMVFLFYINYCFKSVVYMLVKVMMYKFFNIFIDDFFVFIIKMFILY